MSPLKQNNINSEISRSPPNGIELDSAKNKKIINNIK